MDSTQSLSTTPAAQSQPPGPGASRRRLLQIHLSTALIMMLLSGVLIGLNFNQTVLPGTQSANYNWSGDEFSDESTFNWVFHGWPVLFHGTVARKDGRSTHGEIQGWVFVGNMGLPLGLGARQLVEDILVGLFMVVLVGAAWEWRLRGFHRPRIRITAGSLGLLLCLAFIALWMFWASTTNMFERRGWPEPFYYGANSQPESHGFHMDALLIDLSIWGLAVVCLCGLREAFVSATPRGPGRSRRARTYACIAMLLAAGVVCLLSTGPNLAPLIIEEGRLSPTILTAPVEFYGFPFGMAEWQWGAALANAAALGALLLFVLPIGLWFGARREETAEASG